MSLSRWWWTGTLLALYAGEAQSLPFGTFDPRAMAMGGTGVATSLPAEAGYYNPALLAMPSTTGGRFSLNFPTLTANLTDPENVHSHLNDYQSDADRFSAAIDAFKTAPTQPNADEAVASGNTVLNDLRSLSGDDVDFELVAGASGAAPGPRLGLALTLDAHAAGGAMLNVTQSDLSAIETALTKIQNHDVTVTDPTTSMTSSLHGAGAAVAELGVSLGHRFAVAGVPLAVGVTPKLMRVETFDYVMDVNTASLKLSNGRKTYTGVNIDVGAAADLSAHWRAAVTIKDLLSNDYTTALGNVISIKPQARAGVAYVTRHATLALDADLTSNAGAGVTPASRYLALGGEYDVARWVQLRAGYRYNVEDHNTSAASIGLGLSPWGLHIDAAGMVSSRSVGAGLALGARF